MSLRARHVADHVKGVLKEVEEKDWLDALGKAQRLAVEAAKTWTELTTNESGTQEEANVDGAKKKAFIVEGFGIALDEFKAEGYLDFVDDGWIELIKVMLPAAIETIYRATG